MVFSKLLSVIDAGGTADIVTIIDSGPAYSAQIGKLLIIHADGSIDSTLNEEVYDKLLDSLKKIVWTKPLTFSIEVSGENLRIFWDKVVSKCSAIIFGGGHISQPLSSILSLIDFHVTVIDDRPEFANSARFPNAQTVICEQFNRSFNSLKIDENTAVIIVTRGHRYDLDCLRATVASNARYIGMIGSKRRVREILNVLQEEGVPPYVVERLRAPIGLDIKADTPAEIAVSIAAEVVSVFRGGSDRSLSAPREVL